jgi:hypothetical protein
VARYTIHFADSTDQVQDILYGRDVLAFDSAYFLYGKLDSQRAWPSLVGRTRAGEALRCHVLRWVNPRPDVAIRSVDLASLGTVASPVVLGITSESG